VLWTNSTSKLAARSTGLVGRVWVIQESDARTEWMKLMSKVVVSVGKARDKVFASYSAILICRRRVSLGGLWGRQSTAARAHVRGMGYLTPEHHRLVISESLLPPSLCSFGFTSYIPSCAPGHANIEQALPLRMTAGLAKLPTWTLSMYEKNHHTSHWILGTDMLSPRTPSTKSY